MAYNIKRPVTTYYIPLSDKIEKQLDNKWSAGQKGKEEIENRRSFDWLKSMKKSYSSHGKSAYYFASDIIHLIDDHHAASRLLITKGFDQKTLHEKLKAFYTSRKGWHGDSIGHSLAALKAQAGRACNQAMEKPKLHRYYYSHRPPSIGTQPDEFITNESWMPMKTTPHGRTAFGWVEYDRPLTPEELYNYELFEDEPELPKLVKEIVQFAHDEGIEEAMKALDKDYGMAVWNFAKSQKRLKGNGQKEQIRNEIMRLAKIGG